MNSKTETEHDDLFDKIRRARVVASAEDGRDPRKHPNADLLDEETLDRLAELAQQAKVVRRQERPLLVIEAERAKHLEALRKQADRGALFFRFHIADIGVVDDAQLHDLLDRQAQALVRKAALARRSEHSETLRLKIVAIQKERDEALRAEIEAEARKRLGWPSSGWPTDPGPADV